MYVEYSAPKPIATWNPARGVWEQTGQANLFCAHLEPFSATWPSWGMTQGGVAYELQTQEPHTAATEYSSQPSVTTATQGDLLPTPLVDDGKNTGHSTKRIRSLASVTYAMGNDVLLPTPITRDYKDGSEPVYRDGVVQVDTVARAIMYSGEVELLPTPNTMEHREIKTPEQIAELKQRSPGGYRNLREEVVNGAASWGKYAPAIERWAQVVGRPAPSPTLPDGKDNAQRLSMFFAEWLMGLPQGWVTDCGLTRVEALKACGNGVVPQQAELALRILLDGVFPVVTQDTAQTTVTKSLSNNVQISNTMSQ